MGKEKPIRLQAPGELWARERERVRDLRRNLTRTEALLWERLRRSPGGRKFRRQHALGPYIVDFYCVGARLVIELDGLSHEATREYDEVRTKYLEGIGLTVIRFTNQQVINALDDVCASIGAIVDQP